MRRWWIVLWTWKQWLSEILFPKFTSLESCFPAFETSKPAPPSSCRRHLSHRDLPVKRHFGLVVADFEVHQNIVEPAFNSHDQKGSQQKHSRPQKLFLTLPLTYSITLYSKSKQRLDQELSKNWQQVHILHSRHTSSTSTRWIRYTPYSLVNNGFCFMSSPNSLHRLFTALRKSTWTHCWK